MTPIGSQQMVGLMVDMMRSALATFPTEGGEKAAVAADTVTTGTYVRAPNPPPAVGPPLLMCEHFRMSLSKQRTLCSSNASCFVVHSYSFTGSSAQVNDCRLC